MDQRYFNKHRDWTHTHGVGCMVHFGELSAALWQIGKEAPYLAFLRHELNESK